MHYFIVNQIRSALWISLSIAMLMPVSVFPAPFFSDVSSARGLNFTTINTTFFPTIIPVDMQIVQRIWGNGVAVGDADNDGDLDLYILGHHNQANKLFRNNLESGTKSFTDVTSAPLDDIGYGRIAHFVDLDDDGDLDIVLLNDNDGTFPASKLFRNDGGMNFTDVTPGSGFAPLSAIIGGATIADYDADGLLDIYISRWGTLAAMPGVNKLYRGLGNFQFTETQVSAGLGSVRAFSIGTFFGDLDNDLDPDLVVAIDGGRDILYQNTGGSFNDVSVSANVLHLGNDMGIAIGDFDNDDDLDFYQTNITDLDVPPVFGIGRFNILYENQFDVAPGLSFTDEAIALGIEDTHWGWGTEFADLDNDGDLDLVAVSGMDEFVAYIDSAANNIHSTQSHLFVNNGAGFSRLLGAGLDDEQDSRALVAFDYDRDGDQDLLITNINQPVQLLENNTISAGNWLDVGLAPDRLAIGARVYVTVGGLTQRRDIVTGRSFLVGVPSEAHFGLGAATIVDQLRVVWNDGYEFQLEDVAVAQMLRFERNVPTSVTQVLDQQFLTTAPASFGVSSGLARAQTFTAAQSGALNQLDLNLARAPGASAGLRVSVFLTSGGFPVGDPVASVVLPADFIATDLTVVEVDVRPFGITVQAGGRYAIVLETDDTEANAYRWHGDPAGGYRAGQSLENSGSGWVGTSGAADSDFWFKTFVEALATPPAPRAVPEFLPWQYGLLMLVLSLAAVRVHYARMRAPR
ncbi:MAG: FG-GAP-like repeat-containing protein [Pseudomonadota bacterium]